jgi:hypothetical protein
VAAERLGEAQVEALAVLGAAAVEKPGRLPFVSAASVNWLTTSAAPPVSRSERFIRPPSSRKMRRSATLRARRSASASPSPRMAQTRTTRPLPIAAHGLAGNGDRGAGGALDQGAHRISRGLVIDG